MELLKQDYSQIEAIDLNPKSMIKHALVVSSTVTYMKCFNDTNGRKYKINIENYFKGDKKLTGIHTNIKKIRNDYTAHAGKSSFEYSAPLIVLHPEQTKGYAPSFCAHTAFTLPTNEELDDFLLLATTLLNLHSQDVRKRLDDYTTKIISQNNSIDYWYKQVDSNSD